MGNLKYYVSDVESMIDKASCSADNAYKCSYGNFGRYEKSYLEKEADSARRYSYDAYYYAEGASKDLYRVEDGYNQEFKKLVNEINELVDELNKANNDNASKQLSFEEKELIAQIRAIDVKAGTEWYKTVGSKQAKPLRAKLKSLKQNSTTEVEKVKDVKVPSNAFRNTEIDLKRSMSSSYEAEKVANRASYEYEADDVKFYLDKASSEARDASRHADSAMSSFKREVSDLDYMVKDLVNKKDKLQVQVDQVKKSNNRYELMSNLASDKIKVLDASRELINKKDQLSKIYEKAGTEWYKKVGSKQAGVLREEIKALEKRR